MHTERAAQRKDANAGSPPAAQGEVQRGIVHLHSGGHSLPATQA